MSIELKVLKSIKYFIGLDNTELEFIKRYMIEKTVEKGEILLIEGEWSEFLYFVVSGMVKVYKTSQDGKEQIINITLPGDSLNHVSIFDGQPSVANMSTMTRTHFYAIRKEDLKFLLNEHPRISINIIKYLANRVRHDSNLVGDLSSSQVLTRLAKLLYGRYAGEETTIGLWLSQQDMAGMIGTRREVVNRSLKIMEKKGAIKLSPHRVIVVNQNILAEMAEDAEYIPPRYLLPDTQTSSRTNSK